MCVAIRWRPKCGARSSAANTQESPSAADESAEHPAYAGFRGNGKQGFGGNGSDSMVRNGNFAAADLFDEGNIRTD